MMTMKPRSVLTWNKEIKWLFSWRRHWVSSLQTRLLLVFNSVLLDIAAPHLQALLGRDCSL